MRSRKIAMHQYYRRKRASILGGEPKPYADLIKAATNCPDELIDSIGGLMRDEGTSTGTLDALSLQAFNSLAQLMYEAYDKMPAEEQSAYHQLYGK